MHIRLLLGIDGLLKKYPELIGAAVVTDDTLCKKNTGKPKRLRKWPHGHQFVVRGGGHIDTWQPLYRLVNLFKYSKFKIIFSIIEGQSRHLKFFSF